MKLKAVGSRPFRNILCPVDFSEHSRQALAYGALLASRSKRLTVASPPHGRGLLIDPYQTDVRVIADTP